MYKQLSSTCLQLVLLPLLTDGCVCVCVSLISVCERTGAGAGAVLYCVVFYKTNGTHSVFSVDCIELSSN